MWCMLSIVYINTHGMVEFDCVDNYFPAAVHRYYESRGTTYNDSLPHRVAKVAENKKKAKERIPGQGEEKRSSEESSDEESGSMKLYHLEWQSDELEELKQVLDKEKEVCAGRFSTKPRIEGVPSSLPIPRNAVQWAVKM
ncbi:uncharacterized protein [Dysidea avara]|uniref:uncharacterized protein n=1 Tax=Dysidea avara TaxID=196820 RepID=UPI0033334263